jgi:hypothetical protein
LKLLGQPPNAVADVRRFGSVEHFDWVKAGVRQPSKRREPPVEGDGHMARGSRHSDQDLAIAPKSSPSV